MAGIFTFQDIDNGLKDKVTLPPPADISKLEQLQGRCDFQVRKNGDFQIGEDAFSTSFNPDWY